MLHYRDLDFGERVGSFLEEYQVGKRCAECRCSEIVCFWMEKVVVYWKR